MRKIALSVVTSLMCFTFLHADTEASLNLKLDNQPIAANAAVPVVSYADVLDQATPSVVAIYTSRLVPVYERSESLQDLLRQYYGLAPRAPRGQGAAREELRPMGVGSGVIVSENGYIVTNRHVVTDEKGNSMDEIRVRLTDNREFVAELIGADEKTDVAVLKVESAEVLPVITIADSSQLRVGDIVFAIGNPLEVGLTATQGIVSATGRELQGRVLGPGSYENFIQTDAAINPGNSGGALIDAWGRLIGINTAIVSQTGGNIGIGLAVPVNMVRYVMVNLIESGEVPRGLLGLYPTDVDKDTADYLGMETTHGALINQVQEGSPAAVGGLIHGDVITKIDSIKIVSAAQLRLVVSQMLPGTEVTVGFIREGEYLERPVVLGSLNGKTVSPRPSQKLEERSSGGAAVIEGVTLTPLDSAARGQFRIPEAVDGVLVAAVDFQSPYAESLSPGMVILEANGVSVSDPHALEQALKKGVNRLYTWTGGNLGFVLLRIK